jgi:hypothetical protein
MYVFLLEIVYVTVSKIFTPAAMLATETPATRNGSVVM